MRGPDADMMGTQEAEIAGRRETVSMDQGGSWRLFSDRAGADEPVTHSARDLVAAGAPAFSEGTGVSVCCSANIRKLSLSSSELL